MVNLLKTFRLGKVLSILLGVFTISIYALGSVELLQDVSNLSNLIWGLVSLFFIVSAGYFMNDYCDLKYDLVNRPWKAMISKARAEKNVKLLFVTFFFIGLLAALLVNLWFFLIIVADLIVLVLYNLFSKKLFYLKGAVVSLLVVSIYPLSFAITSGGISSLRRDALFIFPIWLFFMILAYELVEDILDIKGDKAGGGSTIPIKIGSKRTRRLAIVIALLATPIAFVPFYYGMCGKVYLIGALLSLPLFVGSMFFKELILSKGLLFYVRAITVSSLVDIILLK